MSTAVIHLVRHAQGFHNLGLEFSDLLDPLLTPLGESQCAQLRDAHFPPERQQSISLVAASPMSRTLQTAHATFVSALSNGKCHPHILAIPDAQETTDWPCDTGSDLHVLKDRAAERSWPVDLSLVSEDWNVKTISNRYSPAGPAIQRRARDARALLREKARELAKQGDENVEIVLVAHGAYMHYISDDWEHADRFLSTGWENCEHRTYTFEKDFMTDDDPEAFLTETMDSRRRRGKEHPMFDHDQQVSLCQEMMVAWEGQGCQNPMKIPIPSSLQLGNAVPSGNSKSFDPYGQDTAPQGSSHQETGTEIEVEA
ncbi:hypothetical protein PV10_07801 [Exophiala mesophila]|uniref:Phosphoglycerate mutase family protein n=1 Tax=Exophiala mesophila TaxID=212818 RepID=A0A0D1Z6S4_EXOME|nr:uncharacterized protein PV10_07801 [Exophiala mesophila]KIV90502.1 hypothetical protein PV10_07801 [Exophiala mesophila]